MSPDEPAAAALPAEGAPPAGTSGPTPASAARQNPAPVIAAASFVAGAVVGRMLSRR